MKLSSLVTMLALMLLGSTLSYAETAPTIEVWKSATCQCCGKWVSYLEANGFAVKANAADAAALKAIKRDAGVPEKLDSCHTAKIDSYVIEGHVPASDIKRLVAEHPDAIGLTVPGMPQGSPGMEQEDDKTQAYDVLLIKKDGTTEIFASH